MKKIITIIFFIAIIAVNAVGIAFGGNSGGMSYELVKAPDQAQCEEHPDFTQEEFEFVAPEGENIAPKGTISSSGYNDVYVEANAIDGDTSGSSYWEGAADLFPNELTVSFSESHKINAIRLALNPDVIWTKRTQTFSVKVTDGSGAISELFPEAAYEFTPAKGNEIILTFDVVEVTAVTVCFTSNTGAVGAQVAEFEIYE